MGELGRGEARVAFRRLIDDHVPAEIRTRVWQLLESVVFGSQPVLRGLEHFEVRYGSGTPTVASYPVDGYGIYIDQDADEAYVVLNWQDQFLFIGGSGAASVPGHNHVEADITDLDHLTEAEISHLNINDIGSNAHAAIDIHIADTTIHWVIGDVDYAAVSGNDPATDVSAAELEELSDGSSTTLHAHDGYVLHSLADAVNDFLVASGDDVFVKKTLAQVASILEGALDHGNIQGLADDDHPSYLLASDATDRETFAEDWEDLTDEGPTILHTHGVSDASVDQKFTLHEFTDVKQRLAVYSIHGGFDSLDTGSALDSVPTDIVATAGLGKILIVVNAGGDFDGEITVTGTTVDRNTGAETGADTEVLTIDALTTDNSSTDAEGNTVHEFVGAYITSKWFLGQFTLSTTNLTLTDVDTYQVSFDQMDDTSGITLQTFDMTVFANNQNAWLYAYLYTMHVTGDKCNIDTEATIELPASKVSADRRYRLKRGEINKSLNGETDGFWFELFPGPLASTYWENIDSYIRGEITRTVDPGDPLGPTPDTVGWEPDTIGDPPADTPMYSGESSTVRALILDSGVPTGLTKMVETITVAGNHIHNWRTASKYDISNGIRVEVVGQFPTPHSNADFYVGLSPVTTADGGFVGLPDHHIMALYRDDDNDFYQRYSLFGVNDWVDENQIDLSFNMTPQTWNHYQFEYKPDDDEVLAQYRQIWSDSAGGFKTLALTSAWAKPQFAYVFWGGLNNSSSFVRVANVWIGALTDAWPYVGAP